MGKALLHLALLAGTSAALSYATSVRLGPGQRSSAYYRSAAGGLAGIGAVTGVAAILVLMIGSL